MLDLFFDVIYNKEKRNQNISNNGDVIILMENECRIISNYLMYMRKTFSFIENCEQEQGE